MKFSATLIISALIMSACNTDVPRPAPVDPAANWIKFCSQKPNCGLCASQANCAFCPTTNQCVYYSVSDQTAKSSCPSLIQTPELCK